MIHDAVVSISKLNWDRLTEWPRAVVSRLPRVTKDDVILYRSSENFDREWLGRDVELNSRASIRTSISAQYET